MNIKKGIIKLAISESFKSDHQYKIGAVIFKGKKIISSGHNQVLRSTKSLLDKYKRWPNSLHAEVASILNAKTDVSNNDILILRVNVTIEGTKFLLSLPCDKCLLYLSYVKIRNIYYSDNNIIKLLN